MLQWALLKNVVNTFFLNQYHPWVTTLSLTMLASCENLARLQDLSFKSVRLFSQDANGC